jgi:protein TonB
MKKFVTIITIAFQTVILNGQQTGTFYFTGLGEVCDKNNAKTKVVIKKFDGNLFKETSYSKSGFSWYSDIYKTYCFHNDSTIEIKEFVENNLQRTTLRKYKHINDSIFSYFDVEDQNYISKKGFASCILPLIIDGRTCCFYKNGKVSYEEIRKKGQLVENSEWDENGKSLISNVFRFEDVDIQPKFISGSLMDYIAKEVHYPEEASKNHIEGRVIARFVIMEDGEIEQIQILVGVHPLLDKEAVRLIKSTAKKWTPGVINNNAVRVYFNIPIRFTL